MVFFPNSRDISTDGVGANKNEKWAAEQMWMMSYFGIRVVISNKNRVPRRMVRRYLTFCNLGRNLGAIVCRSTIMLGSRLRPSMSRDTCIACPPRIVSGEGPMISTLMERSIAMSHVRDIVSIDRIGSEGVVN